MEGVTLGVINPTKLPLSLIQREGEFCRVGKGRLETGKEGERLTGGRKLLSEGGVRWRRKVCPGGMEGDAGRWRENGGNYGRGGNEFAKKGDGVEVFA